eukprot:933326-Rhodomonas_salina.2
MNASTPPSFALGLGRGGVKLRLSVCVLHLLHSQCRVLRAQPRVVAESRMLYRVFRCVLQGDALPCLRSSVDGCVFGIGCGCFGTRRCGRLCGRFEQQTPACAASFAGPGQGRCDFGFARRGVFWDLVRAAQFWWRVVFAFAVHV